MLPLGSGGDAFKLLILCNQQSKTRRDSIYYRTQETSLSQTVNSWNHRRSKSQENVGVLVKKKLNKYLAVLM